VLTRTREFPERELFHSSKDFVVVCGNLVGFQPDAHRIFPRTLELRVSPALQTGERVLNMQGRVIGEDSVSRGKRTVMPV
jgi:hypothetical protein